MKLISKNLVVDDHILASKFISEVPEGGVFIMSKCADQKRHIPTPTLRRSCPYEYEITDDGTLIIDGESYGDASNCFELGGRLRALVTVMHEIAHLS